jgi:hypothetical protein
LREVQRVYIKHPRLLRVEVNNGRKDGRRTMQARQRRKSLAPALIAFALVIFEVPYGRVLAWILLAAYALMVLIGALLFVRRRRKRQSSSTIESSEPEQDGEPPP